MIVLVTLAVLAVSGTAFAVGRGTAPATGRAASPPPGTRRLGHSHASDIAWMRTHMIQMTWLRGHPAQAAWMSMHPADVAWLRQHPAQWQWVRSHHAAWGWMQGHPAAWTWMRGHMADIGWMHDNWHQWRQWRSAGTSHPGPAGITGPGLVRQLDDVPVTPWSRALESCLNRRGRQDSVRVLARMVILSGLGIRTPDYAHKQYPHKLVL